MSETMSKFEALQKDFNDAALVLREAFKVRGLNGLNGLTLALQQKEEAMDALMRYNDDEATEEEREQIDEMYWDSYADGEAVYDVTREAALQAMESGLSLAEAEAMSSECKRAIAEEFKSYLDEFRYELKCTSIELAKEMDLLNNWQLVNTLPITLPMATALLADSLSELESEVEDAERSLQHELFECMQKSEEPFNVCLGPCNRDMQTFMAKAIKVGLKRLDGEIGREARVLDELVCASLMDLPAFDASGFTAQKSGFTAACAISGELDGFAGTVASVLEFQRDFSARGEEVMLRAKEAAAALLKTQVECIQLRIDGEAVRFFDRRHTETLQDRRVFVASPCFPKPECMYMLTFSRGVVGIKVDHRILTFCGID